MVLGKGKVWCPLVREKSPYVFRVIRHDQENLSEVSIFRDDDVEQLCSENVILHFTQLFENLDFSQNLLETIKGFENIIYYFDSKNFFCLFVLSFENLSEGALSDLV